MRRITYIIFFVASIFLLSGIASAVCQDESINSDETNCTNNIRMLNGFATILHDWENNEAGFLGTFGNTNLGLIATTKNLVLKGAGFGVRHVFINTYWNSSTYIGWANGENSIFVSGNNGKVGINTLEPKFQLDVNGTIRADSIKLNKIALPKCNRDSSIDSDGTIARNGTGLYYCENNGWVKLN